MPTPTAPTTPKPTVSAKPAEAKQNNVLSSAESESLTSHLARAIEHICGSVTVLPRDEIAELADSLEQTAVKLRGFCEPAPETTATSWAKQLKSGLDADIKKRRVAENHLGEIQTSLNRSIVNNQFKGDTPNKVENVLAKARKEIVGLLE